MKNVEEKIALLKLLYEGVRVIGDKIAYTYKNDVCQVMDIDGQIVYTQCADSCEQLGNFLVILNERMATLYNAESNRHSRLNLKEYFYYCKIDNVGKNILCFTNGYRLMLLNKDFQIVADIQKVSRHEIYQKGNKIKLRYSINNYMHEMQIDDETNAINYLDYVELTSDRGVVGVCSGKNKCAVNTDTVDEIIYSLCDNNFVPLSAGYDDIIPYTNDIYYKTFKMINGEIKEGLIDKSGRELIPAQFDSVTLFGKDSYILAKGSTRYLFSIEKGLIVNNVDKSKFIRHMTLPIIIVCVDNVFYICDKDNKVFKFEDFTSEYECYYCTEDTNLLKVHFVQSGFEKEKFVTRQLVPVTHMKRVVEAKNYHWERIGGKHNEV